MEKMVNLNHPLVQYVFTLQNCDKKNRKTDFAKGVITNYDAIILFLYALGPLGLSEIRFISKAWKGDSSLCTYFGPTYGFTGAAFTGNKKYTSDITGSLCGGGWRNDPLWFRIQEGIPGVRRYANAITLAGLERASTLIAQLPDHVKK